MPQIHDLNIQSIEPLPTPVEFIEKFPITPQIAQLVSDGREEIAGILRGEGDRLLVIAGPHARSTTWKAGLSTPPG